MSLRVVEEGALSTESPDPALDEEVERALAPYKDLLPPERLADMRAELAEALRTHHAGKRLIDATRPPPVVNRSGDRAIDGVEAALLDGGADDESKAAND